MTFKKRIRRGWKRYKYADTERKKTYAEQRAKNMRQHGWNVIITEHADFRGKFYRLYKRKRR